MADLSRPRASLRRGIPALVVVGAFALASCGGSSGDSNSAGNGKRSTNSVAGQSSRRSTTTSGDNGEVKAGKPVLSMPLDGVALAGQRMVNAQCEIGTTSKPVRNDDATPEERYPSPIVFAVPTSWESAGRSSAGGGSVAGTDVGLNFRLASGDEILVEYKWDERDQNGEILGSDRKPWKSFDYDIIREKSTTRVKFDKIAKVSVGDQDIEIFSRDPAQAPDDLLGEEYRARINMAELPNPNKRPSGTDSYSFVVYVTFASDAKSFTQKDVESIIGSFSMPKCVWDPFLVQQETQRNLDLNGDGKIKSQAEAQQELQEKLDELQKKNESQK